MTENQIQLKRIKQLEDQGYYDIKLTVTNRNGIKTHKGSAILSDICLISMDEYLDLRLVNCYIKNSKELG